MSDNFLAQYLETAAWADGPEGDADIEWSDEARRRAKNDCQKFQETMGELPDGHDETEAAHDFWLTRNGHGAGFWDGDWAEPYATRLDDLAKGFGEIDLYVGDDGFFYFA